MTAEKRNDLRSMIERALADMGAEQGAPLDTGKVNLAELGRRTGTSRKGVTNPNVTTEDLCML